MLWGRVCPPPAGHLRSQQASRREGPRGGGVAWARVQDAASRRAGSKRVLWVSKPQAHPQLGTTPILVLPGRWPCAPISSTYPRPGKASGQGCKPLVPNYYPSKALRASGSRARPCGESCASGVCGPARPGHAGSHPHTFLPRFQGTWPLPLGLPLGNLRGGSRRPVPDEPAVPPTSVSSRPRMIARPPPAQGRQLSPLPPLLPARWFLSCIPRLAKRVPTCSSH